MLNHIRNAALGALAVLALAERAPAQSCAGDLNVDGVIDGGDLGTLLALWGPVTSSSWVSQACDLDSSGRVDGADLGTLLASWGACQWSYDVVEMLPDPAVVTDASLRAAITATGLAWRVRDTATQVEMLLVPPGTFQMGCIMGSDQYGCDIKELPVHQVTLTNAFYLGRYELTQAQWVARMGSNPSVFQRVSAQVPASQVPNRPLEGVSWQGVQSYLIKTGFRLPTEAEWEYACRAGTQTPFYNGSTDDNSVASLAWYSPNSSSQTRPVGGKFANALGFHDMLGNVSEWVNDRFDFYTADAQTNPTGPTEGIWGRVPRGGSWSGGTDFVRSSYRWLVGSSSYADSRIGFRVARNP